MSFNRLPQWISPVRNRSALSALRIWLPVCLLIFTISGEVLAASGSTRLTIRIDQGVVDAIIKWRQDHGLAPVPSPVTDADQVGRREPRSTEADRVLQRMLPVVRAGLKRSLNPQAADRIIRHLQQDALVVFEDRAVHTGSAAGACVSDQVTGDGHTVHSI
jgi:hypothetical protein